MKSNLNTLLLHLASHLSLSLSLFQCTLPISILKDVAAFLFQGLLLLLLLLLLLELFEVDCVSLVRFGLSFFLFHLTHGSGQLKKDVVHVMTCEEHNHTHTHTRTHSANIQNRAHTYERAEREREREIYLVNHKFTFSLFPSHTYITHAEREREREREKSIW